jgi:HK97 family phage major capsid protein
MDNVKDILGKSHALFDEARAILSKENATAEEMESVDRLMSEGKSLQAKAAQLNEIADAVKDLDSAAAEAKAEEAAEVKEYQRDGEFKSFGEMLHAIKVWAVLGQKDSRLKWYSDADGKVVGEVKDLVENVGASGGFLVPTEFIAQLYAIMAEEGFVRSRATKIPMRRRQVNVPVLDQTGTTAGVPHWFGGMTFYWAEEASEKTESDPSFRQISLVAHKMIGYTRASDELVDDSAVSLDAILTGPLGMAGGATWHEEYAFINGTGAGQPLGVINAGATITVNRAAGGPAISYADLANMYESLYPGHSVNTTLWSFNQSCMSNLLTVQDAVGNYVWQPNARDGLPQTIFGVPVQFTEKQPRIGGVGDAVLADWRYYLIGDRQAVTVESTQFDRWRYDETSWRMVHRVDGQPWLSAPLTLQDGTTQVSPFVILGNKST